jgi:hypothetical protein
VHVLQQRFDAPDLGASRDRRGLPADAQVHQAGGHGHGILAHLRDRLGIQKGEDPAAVTRLRSVDRDTVDCQLRHRLPDRLVRHRGGGDRNALKRLGDAAADDEHRLLAQAGDGDGRMRDALDRAQPIADQL